MSADLSWTLQPGVLIGAAIVGGAYVARWRTVRAGTPRARRPTRRSGGCAASSARCWSRWRRSSRRSTRSPTSSSSLHMVQHMLLLDVVPILAILGLTKVILRPVTRAVTISSGAPARSPIPAFAVVLYVGVIWAWHIPAAYDFAVRHPLVHVLEHVTLRARRLALLVAPALADPRAAAPRRHGPGRLHGLDEAVRRRARHGARLRAVARSTPTTTTTPACGGSPRTTTRRSPGLIMAVEQSLVMGIALVVLFMRALSESERKQQRRQRFEPA